jgi:hypothetical protein
MKIILVDPDLSGRTELIAMLQRCGIAVAPFADPRTAFLFLLARLEELDGLLVNDDDGGWSDWLRSRVEILSTELPVLSYSGRHPQREATIYEGARRIGLERAAVER